MVDRPSRFARVGPVVKSLVTAFVGSFLAKRVQVVREAGATPRRGGRRPFREEDSEFMSLLERYIFRKAFINSVGALAALVLIVWIVQALQRVDIVRTSASAAGNMFWIAMMLIPDLAAGVVPFAVVIGAVQALNVLNADSERAVIAA